jgi:hypothetical protein
MAVLVTLASFRATAAFFSAKAARGSTAIYMSSLRVSSALVLTAQGEVCLYLIHRVATSPSCRITTSTRRNY